MDDYRQMKLSAWTEQVEGYADIEQCFRVILTTRLGEIPHRPLFGCDVWRYLDKPLHRAAPAMVAEILRALRAFEPRARITRVTADLPPTADAKPEAHVLVRIGWTWADEARAQAEHTAEVLL